MKMRRLTNENGLIKGNLDFPAIKEAIEKLVRLEDLLEKHNVEGYNDLNNRLKQEECKEYKKSKNFRPYLKLETTETQMLEDIFEIFFYKSPEIKKVKICGYIGQETNLVDKKNNKLNVGDVVDVFYAKDECTLVKKTTIIVEDNGVFFPMGFKSANYKNLVRVKKCTELKHEEKYANCIKVILKEEK